MIQRAIVGAVLLICALAPSVARAQAKNESLLLLRVLAYDRNVSKRAGKTVTIAVVYKPGDAESVSSVRELGRVPIDLDLDSISRIKTSEHAQERALACPARAHDSDPRAAS